MATTYNTSLFLAVAGQQASTILIPPPVGWSAKRGVSCEYASTTDARLHLHLLTPEEMIEHLAGRTIYFVMLRPPVEALRLRESHRGSGLNDFENHLEAAIDKTPRVGLWLESATMTADATVDEILSRREEAQIELRA